MLLDAKVDRKTLIIGLGGGVTTDIVGFAAATVLRGMKFVNVPTSLLAMVDASVGGKTGVNTRHGKNLLGAFWQPSLVLVPIEALETLSDFEYNCGMGEVVKHAVLEETGEFFGWLEAHAADLSNRKAGEKHLKAVTHAVRKCCEIKAAVVGEDEREDGKRALLNLGHTVGHAIEHVLGFGNIAHGVAVAIGTVAEARLAEIRGEAPKGLAKTIAALLQKLNLPYYLETVDIDALLDAVFMDKKREGAKITITVPKAIGNVALVKVDPSELRKAFETLETNKQLLANL
jgi:3-dehydroquinate synthase